MRVSVVLLIFLLLFNGWAGLLQEYDVDDHLGINAETGDPEELDTAVAEARSIQKGSSGVLGSMVGIISNSVSSLKRIIIGVNPGLQMLVNIVPPGPAEDLVVWAYSIVPIIMGIDILAYLRGMDL